MNEARSRVAMLVEPKRIELHDEAAAHPAPGGIVVRVRAALTDGTDLKTYRRGHPKMPMPTRFGHEFCGEVAATGEGVTAFAPGDAVMCTHTAPCGSCFWCRNGQEELCESIMPAMILGAYSDAIAVPRRVVERNCYRKPEDVSWIEGAFLEPLSCVVHSVEMLEADPGSVVAILGNGGFGILHALLLRQRGVEVLLFGRNPQRAALAGELGLENFDTRSVEMEAVVAKRTGSRGADAVVECTGSVQMWERAPALARRGGRVSFFAGLPSGTNVSFDAARLHYDEVRLGAPFHFTPRDVSAAYELICAHALPLTALISGTYPLEQIAHAFERLDSGDAVKLVIQP